MIPLGKDGKQLLYTSIVFLILDVVAVVLRLIAKSRTKSRFSFDDLWIILTLIVFAAWAALVIGSVIDIGGTYNPSALPSPLGQLAKIYKLLYIAELLFIWGITLAKVSILALYASIFTTRKFRLAKDIVLMFCLIWCIAMTATSVVQCIPLRDAWNPLRLTEGKCILFGLFTLFEELTNVVLDIIILLLPIFMIRKLHLPARQRWILSILFLLGGFVCITGILKMAYIYSPSEPKQVPSISLCIMWSTIELGTAIICACVPTYRPLLHGSWFGDWLASARHSARGTSSTTVVQNSSHNGYGDVRTGYNRFTDDTNSDKIFLNEVTGGTRIENNEAHFFPLNAISVERRIEVS